MNDNKTISITDPELLKLLAEAAEIQEQYEERKKQWEEMQTQIRTRLESQFDALVEESGSEWCEISDITIDPDSPSSATICLGMVNSYVARCDCFHTNFEYVDVKLDQQHETKGQTS